MAKQLIHAGNFLLKDGTTVSVNLAIYTHKLGPLIERAFESKGKKTSSWSGGAVELTVQELPEGVQSTIDIRPPRQVRKARKK